MTDRFQSEAFDREPPDPFDDPAPEPTRPSAPLPAFLAARVLRPDETVAWVVGPRFAPSWEQYVTNPALFLVTLIVGALLVVTGRVFAPSWAEMAPWPVLAAGAIVFLSVIVLAFFSGCFTRLVVTNSRLVILQGREVCRSWDVNDLPPSLLRYRMRGSEETGPTIDLNAVKTMLGGSSDRFVESKTILAFGKELGRRNKGRGSGRI